MSTQIDRGHSAQRPVHLNMATPLTARTLEAIQCEITKEMIATIATHARAVIPCTPAAPANSNSTLSSAQPTSYQSSRPGACERLPSPPTTPGSNALSSVPPLDSFITNLVLRSRVQAGTLICTLVYLRRLRRRLPKEARGMECTCHRIFLATLIVAGKYLNDASPKNKYWARYSTVFTVAEVNLMEKQLLFLLDFDLRIDNDDLNDAASSFFVAEAKPSMPLTPTTPPFGTVHLQPAMHESDASLAPAPMASMEALSLPHKTCDGYMHPEPTKVYPSTLGLSGRHASQRGIHPPVAAMDVPSATARELDNTAIDSSASEASLLTALKQPHLHNGASKRQHHPESEQAPLSETVSPGPNGPQDYVGELQNKPNVPFDATQDARYKTPAGPVHQITADDMAQLRPSPKKRAVSRGHYGNIPHPSPVYHCTTTGTHSSAATTAAASALTASSACFLQPLEHSSISYASSRYQQQRYDPHVSRGSQGEARERGVPRAATSIPSFRGPASASLSSTTSPVGNLSSSRSSSTKHAGRCVLRHQSTLPDFSQLSKPAASSAVHLPSLTAGRSKTHADSAKWGVSADTVNIAYSLRPTQPPLARLASSNSYAVESSPVHTLVFDGCSPVVGSTSHKAGNAAHARHPVCSTSDNIQATPAYALTSLSADAQGLTLSEATDSSGSKHCSSDSTAAAIYADVSCVPTANGLQTEYTQATASGNSGNGTGWHLKSRILHPLSTWFRSARQGQHNGNYVPPATLPTKPDSAGSGQDERVHAGGACQASLASQTIASAPALALAGTCSVPR
ncbi:PHO85 cyclin-1 [Coemansia sp. BCRC 34301]|nr:PHO85 cyclin-1 [Coemansia sp. BCRC 34301]